MKLKHFLPAFILSLTVLSCSGNDSSASGGGNDEKSGEPKPVHLTKETFKEKIMNYEKNTETWVYEGERPAVIDFYADWCAPCKKVAPIMEDLAKEYDGQVDIYKIDTEDQKELAAVFGIKSIPSVLFIPMNGQPQMTRGALPKENFVNIVEQFLLNNPNDENK